MKKFFLLAAVCAATLSANATDFYVIGDNVNGGNWALAAPDAKMTDLGDGVYEWKGQLGTGFKINDGTWNNIDLGDGVIANFGSNGDGIVVGEPYYFETGGSTSDIQFASGTIIEEATVTLNMNDMTITLAGEPSGTIAWYICGDFNAWAMGSEDAVMEEVEEGKLVKKGLVIPAFVPAEEGATAGFKIASTGYATAYGAPAVDTEADPEAVAPVISAENLTAAMQLGGGNLNYTIEGTYDVEFTFGEEGAATVVFSVAGSGVEGIAADADAEVVYYNLQGVRVEKPVNGVFVKVVNKKATKVLAK